MEIKSLTFCHLTVELYTMCVYRELVEGCFDMLLMWLINGTFGAKIMFLLQSLIFPMNFQSMFNIN